MDLLESFLLVLHLIVALVVCGLVLLQHGKGADMGAAFGSGSSGSLFGASGSANFLSRTTAVLAAVFFVSSLGLTYLGSTRGPARGAQDQGVMGDLPAAKTVDPAKPAVPAAPGVAPVPAPASVPAPAGTATPGSAPSKAGEVPK